MLAQSIVVRFDVLKDTNACLLATGIEFAMYQLDLQTKAAAFFKDVLLQLQPRDLALQIPDTLLRQGQLALAREYLSLSRFQFPAPTTCQLSFDIQTEVDPGSETVA